MRGPARTGAVDPSPNPGAPPAASCRPGCGACCIAPSIASPIPGMPQGKPAGVACVQLAPDLRCRLFGDALRPRVCAGLKPAAEICGYSRDEALRLIADLETRTAP